MVLRFLYAYEIGYLKNGGGGVSQSDEIPEEATKPVDESSSSGGNRSQIDIVLIQALHYSPSYLTPNTANDELYVTIRFIPLSIAASCGATSNPQPPRHKSRTGPSFETADRKTLI